MSDYFRDKTESKTVVKLFKNAVHSIHNTIFANIPTGAFYFFFLLFFVVECSGYTNRHNTVCPGSSDPPDKIFNISASENEVYTIY